MATYYWFGGTGTWSSASGSNWSTALPTTFTGSMAGGTTLTVSGLTGAALAIGKKVRSCDGFTYQGTIVGGSGTSWTMDTAGTFTSIAMGAGTESAVAPTSADNVIFNAQAGAGSVVCAGDCLDMTASAVTSATLFSSNPNIYGSVNLGASATPEPSTGLTLLMQATTTGKTVTISNATVVVGIQYLGIGGGWTQSASTVNGGILVNSGTVTFSGAITTHSIEVNGGTLNTGAFTHSIRNADVSVGTVTLATGTLNLTNSTLNIGTTLAAGNSGAFVFTVFSGATLTTTGSSIVMGSATAGAFNTISFDGNGRTYNSVTLRPGSAGIIGANTFTTLNISAISTAYPYISFDSNQTCTGAFTLQGSTVAQYRLSAVSTTPGTQRTITLSSATAGSKILRWVDLADIAITNTGAALTPTLVGDCGNNTVPAGTLAAAVTCYAKTGATAFNWSGAMWFTTSGGATAQRVPLAQDTVIFDANTGAGTVTVDVPLLGGNISFTGWAGTSLAVNSTFYAWFLYGTITNASNAFANATNLTLARRANYTLSLPTLPAGGAVFLNNPGGTVTLGGALTADIGLSIANTTFTTNNNTLTLRRLGVGSSVSFTGFASESLIAPSGCGVLGAFGAGAVTSSTVNLGSSTVNLTASWLSATGSSATVNAGTSTINLSYYTVKAAQTATGFRGGGKTYNILNFGYTGSEQNWLCLLDVSGSTFSSWTNTNTKSTEISIITSTTVNVSTLNLFGNKLADLLISANSTTDTYLTTQATIAVANNSYTDKVAYRSINKSGAGTLRAAGVANLGNNSGITFISPVRAFAFTGNVGSANAGSFLVPRQFAGSSAIVVIGGGGGSAKRNTIAGSGGGGSGGMSIVTNLNVSPGQIVYYNAGSGGTGGTGATGGSGGSGTSSWLNVSANSAPTITDNGAVANGGGGSSLSASTGGTAASSTTAIGYITYAGSAGGAASATGGGGASAPSLTYRGGFAGGSGSSTTSAGGRGGSGQRGAGGANLSTTGGQGGANLSNGNASGGATGNPGSAGTIGGGGGGGGGSTTAAGREGGNANANNEFSYVFLNGVAGSGQTGSSGGGGSGGATSAAASVGGAGGSASIGGGAGGSSRGSSVANNGNGGNGGVGLVLFIYTISQNKQACFIG